MTRARTRTRPSTLHQEPESVSWARNKCGLTKSALADLVGISAQLMGEIESGWRSATPARLAKIAEALNCPVVMLERKRTYAQTQTETEVAAETETQTELEIEQTRHRHSQPMKEDDGERDIHPTGAVSDVLPLTGLSDARTEIRRWT